MTNVAARLVPAFAPGFTSAFALVLALGAVLVTGGCDPCKAAHARVEDRLSACGVGAEEDDDGDEADDEESHACTADEEAEHTCQAVCYEGTDCAGIPGADDYDAGSDAAAVLADCLADC